MYCLLSLILYAIPFSIEWSSLPSGGIIAVECAGDVNSDGTEDVYAASNSYGIGCLDGISGDVLWWKSGIPKPYSTECFRTVGDIDLDGVADLAVGTGVEYAIIAISGATGDILWISKQNEIPLFIQKANGPEPGDVFVLASKVHPYDWCEFFALDGQSGYLAWSTSLISTLSFLMCVTENDVSGNGWSEMGYVIDRSTVMNGAACVRDGHTGVNIGGAGAWFYPSMDITDTPIPCLAVSNWGNDPVMWVEDIITGITVWSSNDPSLSFQVLKFIPNITGAATPYPEILSRQGVNIRLIRGDDGYFQDTYTFPASIKSVESYLDGSLWRAAVTTSTSLHCPLLTFESPSIEPSVQLPGSGGTDMCFLNSDLYPTPLIAISMGG